MRPVWNATDVEYVLDESVAMISKGDLEGKITYVNRDFVEVSGYTEDEVLGAPQSILADGETPSQVFEDFLRTVKGNKTWTGVTKGRRKNGDYFWVHMTAAPIFREREIVGFITIRCKATPDTIREAEQAYAAMHGGRKDLELNEGRIVKRPVFRVFWAIAHLSFAARMNALSALATSIFTANLAAFAFDSGPPRVWQFASCAIGMALCLISPALLQRGITNPLAQLNRYINDMGEGNLSNAIETHRDGEIAQVLHALRILQINLKLLVSQIQETTDLVNDGATTIATGNADLFARTEAQAASLEQVAASMRELIDTVTANAENARHRHNAIDQGQFLQDRGHHRRDRQHRVPDQYPGAERSSGSRTRGGTGARICSRRQRGAQSRASFRERRQGNRHAHRRFCGQRRNGWQARRRCERHDHRYRHIGRTRHRVHG